MVSTPPNKSIAKAIRVLEIVCGSPQHLSIREIAARANYSLATTHRVLATLRQVGAVEAISGQWFALGPKLVELHGRIAADLSRTKETVERELKHLLREPGVSARLSLFAGNSLVIIAGCDNGVHYRFRSKIGGHYQAYCTAPGKTLLAALPQERLDRYLLTVPLRPMTRKTIVELDRLKREILNVRAAGFALDDEEYIDGVRCVSVAVPASSAREVAALSLASESVTQRELMGSIVPRLTSHARALAGELQQLPRGLSTLLRPFAMEHLPG
jgi:DNA-binding IclR family transcriptional regulator